MTKPAIDFSHVEEHQHHIHTRLINWARWVTPRTGSAVSPMFRGYRSHAWQWHTPEIRETCDILDAQAIEKIVAGLPEKHRYTLRWAYVVRCTPAPCARALGLSYEGLYRHLCDARQMVMSLVD